METEHSNLEEGEIVLCTVKKIIGTTVFVDIDGNGEGTLITSEISPGRIRNLRDYVVPGKKIVCKVLHIRGNNIHLSLRRVKQTEKKELLDKLSKEQSYKAIFKTVLGKEKAEEVVQKITTNFSLIDFIEKIKVNKILLEDYLDKEESKKILKILESKKEKPKEIKQIFRISNSSSEGIKIIKKILEDLIKELNLKIEYLAAGRYRVVLVGEDFKKLKSELREFLEKIEKLAKKNNCEFSIEKSN